jgi:hypothetical protein
LPAEHEAVPPLELQALPQPLQLNLSLFKSISQPFETLPSQLAYPGVHVMLHTPALHKAVPCVELHLTGQVAQCKGSLFKSASQPSVTSPLQSPWPG